MLFSAQFHSQKVEGFKFLLGVLEVHCRSCVIGFMMSSCYEIDCLEYCFEFISFYLGLLIESKEN